jgi:hypothetical protein
MERKTKLLKAEKDKAKERTSRAIEKMENEIERLMEKIERKIKDARLRRQRAIRETKAGGRSTEGRTGIREEEI